MTVETPKAIIVRPASIRTSEWVRSQSDKIRANIGRRSVGYGNLLEAIANGEAGVEKSFAISAGREVRVIVKPEAVDDLQARRIARDIADKIEKEMQYPGEIKISVIRETRVIEYAR